MFDLTCSKCARPLTYPFTSKVFTIDGDSYELRNRVPDKLRDSFDAVVVYVHDDCRRQGHCSAKILRKKAREAALERVRERMLTRPRLRPVGLAQRLMCMGYDVTVVGEQIVRVLPAVGRLVKKK